MKRRDFLTTTAAAVGAAALSDSARTAAAPAANAARPNVLWISVEDISADLGCYGDDYAVTPNIDAFAKQATRFDNCFAHMGVCAPARSGIITGMYPTSIGTNHMRCRGVPQPEVRCFTEYLRAAGYWCTNRSKTDYQFDSPATAWDTGGKGRDWHGRAERQSFFSVINIGTTHEGQVRNEGRRKQIASSLSAEERHDPAKAPVPPYHPDTPIVRRDWAQYYDLLTLMDKEVASILTQLEDEGLAEDTIVWFWGDHGRGLPRGKRWIYDSGMHVPLIVRVPEKWRKHVSAADTNAFAAGTVNDDLVSFVDFAPTMLSLCGVPIPKHIQGQAFLAAPRARAQKAAPREYVYGARDRVDEAYDMIRAVRDKRFKYLRNFMAHLPRSLDVDYMNQMPTMQEMRRLHAEGKLKGPELQYFECPKPIEELYDTDADPHEVHNLAADPKHAPVLERMRGELFAWMRETGDFGLLPECEFDALKRPGDAYEVTSAPGIAPLSARSGAAENHFGLQEVRNDSRASGNAGEGATAVELTCATLGASIAYRVEGEKGKPPASGQFLPVDKAEMHGKGAKRQGGEVSSWRDPKTWLSWEVEIEAAGTIPVHVHQAFARGDGGCPYTISVGDSQIEGVVQKTGGWDDFQFVKVGEVQVPKPGKYTVSIKPKDTSRPYSMDLRAIVLNGKDLESYSPPTKGWQLYTRPLTLEPGQRLTAKACRLGFKDSATIRWSTGDDPVPPEKGNVRPHWRQVVDESGVIDRALALKALDGQPNKAIDAYVKALTGPTRDESGTVRYWAVRGLHTNAFTLPVPNESKAQIEVVRACLDDPSPAVRVAAAQALCDWGEADKALPVFVEALKQPLESACLHAATALNQIGEKARPVLADIKALAKGGYPARMAKHIERALGG